MKSRIEKAIKYIKGYCDKHSSCDGCKLYNEEEEHCKLREEIPCEWDIKMGKQDCQ